MAEIIIVIPTYNEASNIEILVSDINKHLKKEDYSVYFIDDNSSDGTADKIKEMSLHYPLRLFQRTGKLGLGSAYVYGFTEAIKEHPEFIMAMDADLSHQPKDIPRLIAKARTGVDVVIGSRYVPGGGVTEDWGWLRKLMSKTANLLAATVLQVPSHDMTGSFRCYNRKVLENLGLSNIKSDGYSFFEEILFLVTRKGYSIAEVPIKFLDRQYGKSKLSKKEIPKFLWMLVRLRFSR